MDPSFLQMLKIYKSAEIPSDITGMSNYSGKKLDQAVGKK
jgi:hypothetical protein